MGSACQDRNELWPCMWHTWALTLEVRHLLCACVVIMRSPVAYHMCDVLDVLVWQDCVRHVACTSPPCLFICAAACRGVQPMWSHNCSMRACIACTCHVPAVTYSCTCCWGRIIPPHAPCRSHASCMHAALHAACMPPSHACNLTCTQAYRSRVTSQLTPQWRVCWKGPCWMPSSLHPPTMGTCVSNLPVSQSPSLPAVTYVPVFDLCLTSTTRHIMKLLQGSLLLYIDWDCVWSLVLMSGTTPYLCE